MRFPSWYGITVGLLIVLQWIFFAVTDSVPELQIAPWEIGLHISAELLLAITLLVGGIVTLSDKLWGKKLLLAGLGMTIYSEINSPGYFAQLGQWEFVAMFAVLLLGATAFTPITYKTGSLNHV